MKQALIIRAHSVTSPLINLINRAKELDFPVFLAVDESNHGFPSTFANKVSLTPEKLDHLALPQVPNCFWLIGDYALYVCRHDLEKFDFYWMVEQDVCINFSNIQNFFDLFAGSDDDLLAPELEEIEPGWWTWTETMQPFVGQTWRCFFPVTRLSGRAIDYLYRRRISISNFIEKKLAKSGVQLAVPNDEAFVSSELCEAGFSCKDLSFYAKNLYSRDTFRFRKPMPEKIFQEHGPDRRIYHPVVDDSEFLSIITKRFQFLARRQDVDKLKIETDYESFGGLKHIIDRNFGTVAVRNLEQECPLLLGTWI